MLTSPRFHDNNREGEAFLRHFSRSRLPWSYAARRDNSSPFGHARWLRFSRSVDGKGRLASSHPSSGRPGSGGFVFPCPPNTRPCEPGLMVRSDLRLARDWLRFSVVHAFAGSMGSFHRAIARIPTIDPPRILRPFRGTVPTLEGEPRRSDPCLTTPATGWLRFSRNAPACPRSGSPRRKSSRGRPVGVVAKSPSSRGAVRPARGRARRGEPRPAPPWADWLRFSGRRTVDGLLGSSWR